MSQPMNIAPEEQRAIDLFTKFVRRYKDELAPIAMWGDSRCGYMHQLMANVLLGPELPSTQPPKRSPISASVRRRIHERDLYRCVQCGSHQALRIDHIHPWSKGGSDDEANLQTLCHPCNQAKRDKVPAT